jgi:hypothetical protein
MDTAVLVTLLDETNIRLDGVQVSYRVNGGEWQAYPERVNGRITFRDVPGIYEIRAQKPGYQTATAVVPLAAFSCNGEPAQTTPILPYAQCPADPHPLLIQLPDDSPQLSATDANGRERTPICQSQGQTACQNYALPLLPGDGGNFSLTLADLPGIGDMTIVDDVIAYEADPFVVTLAQGNRQQAFNLAAAASATLALSVARDEAGCPWVDFTAVTTPTTTAYPEPGIYLAGNLLIPNLSAESCQQTPILTDITYYADLPPDTNLNNVQMIYWRDEEWVTADCRLENGQYLCTAQLPNPLINQTYSVRLVINGEQHIGTHLPFTNMCMIFGN